MVPRLAPAAPQLRRARLARCLPPDRRSPARSRRCTRSTSRTPARTRTTSPTRSRSTASRSTSSPPAARFRIRRPASSTSSPSTILGPTLVARRRQVRPRRRQARPRRRRAAALRRPQLAQGRHRLGADLHAPRRRARAARRLLRRLGRLGDHALLRPDLGVPGVPARDRARLRARDQRLPPLRRSTSRRGSLWIPTLVISYRPRSRTSAGRSAVRSCRCARRSSSRRRSRRARARSA